MSPEEFETGLMDRSEALRVADALNRCHPGNTTRTGTLFGVNVVFVPGGSTEKYKPHGKLLCSVRGKHNLVVVANELPHCSECGWTVPRASYLLSQSDT